MRIAPVNVHDPLSLGVRSSMREPNRRILGRVDVFTLATLQLTALRSKKGVAHLRLLQRWGRLGIWGQRGQRGHSIQAAIPHANRET